MASERVERRLTAILAADVVGYSRLMGAEEEEHSLRVQGASARDCRSQDRRAPRPHRQDHGRRPARRVRQRRRCGTLRRRHPARHGRAQRPAAAERRSQFRIGVNVGDIVIDESDIFGDGVNVAARLEALAEPGGICISRTAYDQLHDKLDITFEDFGEQQVKNIARPVRAYRVVTDAVVRLPATAAPCRRRQVPRWVIAAGIAGMVLGAAGAAAFRRLCLTHPAPTAAGAPAAPPVLPDKPSIAVLPFANLSGDPAQDYLADGLTDNLLDALAQNPGLFVIARNATQVYRGKAVAPRAVAKDSASATCWKAACRNPAIAFVSRRN